MDDSAFRNTNTFEVDIPNPIGTLSLHGLVSRVSHGVENAIEEMWKHRDEFSMLVVFESGHPVGSERYNELYVKKMKRYANMCSNNCATLIKMYSPISCVDTILGELIDMFGCENNYADLLERLEQIAGMETDMLSDGKNTRPAYGLL